MMRIHDRRGITILEIIVAMGIFGLMITSVVGVFLVSNRSKDIVFDQLEVQGQARKAVQDFVNEVRVMQYSSSGSYPIQKASSTEIIFYSNIDSDSGVERLRYFFVTNTFKRGVIEPSGSPVTYVTSSERVLDVVNNITNGTSTIFMYYDENYTGVSTTPLSQPVDVTRVRVVGLNLVIDKNPTLSPVPLSVQGTANIRNLKAN